MRPSRGILPFGPSYQGKIGREDGQVLVFFVLLLPVLVGAAGLLTDVAMIARVQSQLRATAGAASRAGAGQIAISGLQLMDWLSMSEGDATSAAQKLCNDSAADAPGLDCSIEVAAASFAPPEGGAFTQMAWALFFFRDNTSTPAQPGWTVHGKITVTARRNIQLYFLPLLTRQRWTEVSASQSAMLVSGP